MAPGANDVADRWTTPRDAIGRESESESEEIE